MRCVNCRRSYKVRQDKKEKCNENCHLIIINNFYLYLSLRTNCINWQILRQLCMENKFIFFAVLVIAAAISRCFKAKKRKERKMSKHLFITYLFTYSRGYITYNTFSYSFLMTDTIWKEFPLRFSELEERKKKINEFVFLFLLITWRYAKLVVSVVMQGIV